MPLAELVSAGQPLSVWYDIYGLGATPYQPSDDSDDESEPKARRSITGLVGSVLGAATGCKRQPQTASVTEKAARRSGVAQDQRAAEHPHLLSGKPAQAQHCEGDLALTASAFGQAEAGEGSEQEVGPVAPPTAFSHATATKETELRAEGVPVVAEGRHTASANETSAPHQQHHHAEATSQQPHRDGKGGATDLRSHDETADAPNADAGLKCNRVMFIAGLGARGRTEFFQHMVEHLSSLVNASGEPLLSVCTFDNRGIGGSSVPTKRRKYTTRAMAHDTLALLAHLGWPDVHIIGLSLGGMIGCKIAAMSPASVASLTVIGTTPSGWHMLAGISTQPVMATLAGSGPLKWKIPANLRYNFSDAYLEAVVEGGKTRMQVLIDNTRTAIEEKDTEKFLAEGQSTVGREGHLAAVFKHRMLPSELKAIRKARVPCLVLVGRYDRLARAHYVSRLAKELHCTYIVVEAGHAGIMIEALDAVVPLLEGAILGSAVTSAVRARALGANANREVLRDSMYAREFASSFAPGRVSFRSGRSVDAGSSKSGPLRRSKSAVA